MIERLSSRAWSRAGAVADVLRAGQPRRVLGSATRVALLVGGSAVISVSVALTLWTRLGPGPLDVFIGAIRNHTGLPLSVAVWVTVGSLIAVATLLGRRPGPGTFVSPFLIGPMLQWSLALLESVGSPDLIAVRLLLQILAIGGIGIGSGALIVSGLGAGSGELFAGAASDRTGRSEQRVRLVAETTWIIVGVALGGPAGIGTVMVAAMIGPSVAHGHRVVDGIVAGSVNTVDRGLDAVSASAQDYVRA